jgi:hypothetical protein
MNTTDTTDTVEFALRTTDAAWVKRNNGRTDDDGRTVISVPLSYIKAVKFAGKNWLRLTFADCPRDIPNATVMCPADYVPDTAARLTFETEDMRGDFLRRFAKNA